MIPGRLRLRNFLSYHDCTVDFTQVQMAVLTGKNGHGKSALLDAMTWALWNKARGNRGDEHRIRHTATEMLVEFEFEVEGDRYLVVRKRTRGKAASLDFFHLGPEGERSSLSGGSIRETEAEIQRIVRLDYDTFMNSAYLAQGRADEFTTRTPGGRKEVLARILALDRYDDYAEAAKERRVEAASSIRGLEQQIEQREEDVKELPQVRADLEQAEGDLRRLAPRIEQAESTAQQLRAAAQAYDALREEVEAARTRLDRETERCQKAENELTRIAGDMAKAEATMAQRDEIERQYAELTALRAENATLDEQREQAGTAQAEIDRAESAIANERTRLETSLDNARRQRARHEADAARLANLEAREKEMESEARAIEEEKQAVETLRTSVNELRERAAGLEAEKKGAFDHAQEIKERQLQLEAAEGARCPVCQQPLDAEEAERVREEYRATRKDLGDRYRKAEQDAAEASQRADAQEKELAARERDVRRREQAFNDERMKLHASLDRARDAGEQMAKLDGDIEALQDTLAREDFAAGAREALHAARQRLESVGYDEARHRHVRERLRELEPVEGQHRALEQAIYQYGHLQQQQQRQQAALNEYREDVRQAEEYLRTKRAELEAAEDVHPRLDEAERSLAALRSQEQELHQRRGALQQRAESLQALEARIETDRDHLRGYKEEEETYTELAAAFGRSGVQALLIDLSTPRITDIANDLLSRMSGDGTRVELRTQRQTKSESVQETLDIVISDGRGGERDYELYSGGERFRIDLALRIALARLLAERAGARLPTLIIDEGFGTQDEEGVTRLVEALTAVRDDFEFILVVTHLEEMKAYFPERIEVTKTRQDGSIARVIA